MDRETALESARNETSRASIIPTGGLALSAYRLPAVTPALLLPFLIRNIGLRLCFSVPAVHASTSLGICLPFLCFVISLQW